MTQDNNPSNGPLDPKQAAAIRARRKAMQEASTSMMDGNDRRDTSQYDMGATADVDLNELRAARQTGWDKIGNGSVKVLNTGLGSILEGLGVIGGAGVAAGAELVQRTTGYGDGWDSDTVFKNPFVEYMSELQDTVRQMVPHYASQQEEQLSALERLGTANFWTDTMAEAAGFAAGAMFQAGLVSKLGKGFLMANMAGRAGNMNLLTKLVGSTESAHAFKKVVDGTSLFAGAMAGRVGESAIEANGLYDQVYSDALKRGESEGRAIALARDARATTFGWNMMLAVPDMFQYAKIFGTFKHSKDMIRSVKGLADGTVEVAKRGVAKKMFSYAAPVIGNMVLESQEENYQLAVSNMAAGIASGKYDEDAVKSWQGVTGAIMSEMVGNFFTKEGQESMLAGAILGGAMVGPTTAISEHQKTKYTNAAVQRHNEFVKKQQMNILTFASLENSKQAALEEGDRLMFDTLKQTQFNDWVRTKIDIGRFDDLITELEAWGTDTSISPEELNSMGQPKTPAYIAKKAIAEARRLEKIYNSVDAAFPQLEEAGKVYLYHNLSMQEFMDKKIAKLGLDVATLEAAKATAEATGVPFQASLEQTKQVKDRDSLLKAKATLVKEYQEMLDPKLRAEKVAKLEKEKKKAESKVEEKEEEAPENEEDNLEEEEEAPEGNLPALLMQHAKGPVQNVNEPGTPDVEGPVEGEPANPTSPTTGAPAPPTPGTPTSPFGGVTVPGDNANPDPTDSGQPTQGEKRYTAEEVVTARKAIEKNVKEFKDEAESAIDTSEETLEERLKLIDSILNAFKQFDGVNRDLTREYRNLVNAAKKLKDKLYEAYEGTKSPESRSKEELMALRGILAGIKGKLGVLTSKEIEEQMIPVSQRVNAYEEEFGTNPELEQIKKDYNDIREAYKKKLASEGKAARQKEAENRSKLDPNFYSKVQTAYLERDAPDVWAGILKFNEAIKNGEKPTEVWVESNGKNFDVYATLNGEDLKIGYLNQPNETTDEEITKLTDPVNARALNTVRDLMTVAAANPGAKIPISVEFLTDLDTTNRSNKPLSARGNRFKDSDGKHKIYRVRKSKTNSPTITDLTTKMPARLEDSKGITLSGVTDGYVLKVSDPLGQPRFIALNTPPVESLEDLWEIAELALGSDASMSRDEATKKINREVGFIATNQNPAITSKLGTINAKFHVSETGVVVRFNQNKGNNFIGFAKLPKGVKPTTNEELVAALQPDNQLANVLKKAGIASVADLLGNAPVVQQLNDAAPVNELAEKLIPVVSDSLYGAVNTNVLGHAADIEAPTEIKESTAAAVEEVLKTPTAIRSYDTSAEGVARLDVLQEVEGSVVVQTVGTDGSKSDPFTLPEDYIPTYLESLGATEKKEEPTARFWTTDPKKVANNTTNPNPDDVYKHPDGDKVENTDWAEVEREVERTLPEGFTVSHLKNLLNGLHNDGTTWGAFSDKVIYLADKIGKGTVSHEIFHAVFRHLLTKEELEHYYREASKKVDLSSTALDAFRNKYTKYQNYSDAETRAIMLEEHMADEYMKFANNRKKYGVFHKMYTKIKQFLDWLLGNRDTLRSLFHSIDKGAFRNATIQSSARGDIAYKSLPNASVLESRQIIATVTAQYVNRMFEGTVNDKGVPYTEVYDGLPQNLIIQSIIDELKEDDTMPLAMYTHLGAEAIKNLQQSLKIHRGDAARGEDASKLYKATYTVDAPVIIDQTKRALKYFGFEAKVDDAVELDEELDTANDTDEDTEVKNRMDFDASPFEVGGLGNVAKEIKAFIGLTLEKVPGKKLARAVDTYTTFSQIQRILAGKESFEEMIDELRKKARSNPHIQTLVDKMLRKGPDFQLKFQQAFTIEAIEHLHVDFDKTTGKAIVYAANRRDVGEIQLANFKKRFESNVMRNGADTIALRAQEIAGVIGKVNDMVATQSYDQSLVDTLQEKLTTLGIDISADFIEDVIKNDNKVYTLKPSDLDEAKRRNFFDEINAIVTLIANGENPYKSTDVVETDDINRDDFAPKEGTSTDAISRIKRLGVEDAKYKNDIVNPSFQNAEGKSVFSYVNPSFIVTKARQLNEGTIDIDFNAPYYALNPFVKAHVAAKKEGNDLFASMKLSAFNGIREKSEKEGVTFKNMDAKTMLIASHALYRDNKFLPFVIEAKSTTFALSVPQGKKMTNYTVKDGLDLTNSTVLQLMDFVKQDLTRINKTIAEVRNALDTNDFSQLAEGFHFSGDRPVRKKLEGMLSDWENIKDRSKFPRGFQIVQFPGLNSYSREDLENPAVMKKYFNEYFANTVEEYKKILADNDLNITTDPKTGRLSNESQQHLKLLLGDAAYKALGQDKTIEQLDKYLGEFMVKDFVVANGYAQLIRGDEALYKNGIDITKRAAALLATGKPRISRGNPKITAALIADDIHHIYNNGMTRLSEQEEARVQEIKDKDKEDITEEDKAFMDSISEVNGTDAQGWSSGNNFKEILRDLGRLTPAAEKILNKLIAGDVLTEDERRQADSGNLFVANSIKNVYFDGKVYIKTSLVPLFKEFTSDRNPNYNPAEIESESNAKWVAKPGLQKLHNLREQMEGEEYGVRNEAKPIIDEVYHESAFKMWKQSKNFRDSQGNFSGMMTQQLDKKHWRLQVENPSGKTKITYGTQILMLIDSEMLDSHEVEFRGETVPLGEVRNQYKELLGKVRARDFTKADKVLDLLVDGKSIFAEKLQEMLEDSNADQNTIDFFAQATALAKDAKGEDLFEHSVDLPAIAKKFQQLFLSHFGKTVFSQKAAGSKFSLISSSGYQIEDGVDADGNPKFRPLKMHGFKLDDNGKPTFEYAECVISEEILVKYGITREEFESNNIPQEVRDEVMTMLGFRIPTQSHHSMIPFKVVKWMPAYYGSVIIAPAEITYLSGADYDIDSLFVLRKEFRVNKDKTISVYSDNKTDTELWEDYLAYEFKNNKPLKNIYNRKVNSNPEYGNLRDKISETKKKLKDLRETKKVTKEEIESLNEMLSDDSMMGGNLEIAKEQLLEKLQGLGVQTMELRGLLTSLQRIKDGATAESFKALGMPSTPEEFTTASYSNYKVTAAADYNKILDLNFAFMSNYENRESLFTPASMDTINHVAKIVDKFKATEGAGNTSYNMSGNRFTHWVNNSVGKSNVGNAANANLISAFLTKNQVPLSITLQLDNKSYSGYESNYEFDIILTNEGDVVQVDETYYTPTGEYTEGYEELSTPNGELYYRVPGTIGLLVKRRKADSLSTVVSSMTDNAKERHAARLNLTQVNLSEYSNMIALGMGMNRVMLFANQPILVELSKRIEFTRTHIQVKNESSFDLVTKFRDRIEALLGKDNLPTESNPVHITAESLLNGVKNFNEVWDIIKSYKEVSTSANKPEGYVKPEHLDIFRQQYQILNFYHTISKVTEDFGDVGKILSLNKTMGVEFESIDKIEKAYKKLVNYIDPPFIDVKNILDTTNAHSDKNVSQNMVYLKKISLKLPKFFIQRTNKFISIVERFTGTATTTGLGIANNRLTTLNRDLTLFLGVKLTDKFYKDKNVGKVADLTKLLTDEENNIVAKVNKVMAKFPNSREGIVNNAFLNQLVAKTPEGKTGSRNPFYRLEYNTRQGSDPAFVEMLVDSYIELSKNPDPDVKDLSLSLYRYLLIKDNLGFSNNSFVKLLPAYIFTNFSKQLKTAKKVFGKEDNKDEIKELFGMTDYELQREFIIKWYAQENNRQGVNHFSIGKGDYISKSAALKSAGIVEYDFSPIYGPSGAAKLKKLLEVSGKQEPLEFRGGTPAGGIRFPEVYSTESTNQETGKTVISVYVRESKLIYKDVQVLDTESNTYSTMKLPVGARYRPLHVASYAKHMSVYGLEIKDGPDGIGLVGPTLPTPPTPPTGGRPSPNPSSDIDDLIAAEIRAAEEAAMPSGPTNQTTTQKVEIFKGFWSRDQVAKDTNRVYLFGDNTDDRVNTRYIPSATQAVIRGLPNAFGIDTKKNRGTATNSYFTDADFDLFKRHVDSVIDNVVSTGKTIVLPSDGIGTGKAMLEQKAPKLFAYLKGRLTAISKGNFATPTGAPVVKPSTPTTVQGPNGPAIVSKGTKIVNFGGVNPAELGEAPEDARPDLQKPSERKKISKEAAEKIVSELSTKFGVEAVIINDPSQVWAGKYHKGVATINLAYATEDTPFHEFAHPFIKAIKKTNPTLYNNLAGEIQGTETLKIVKEKYPELSEEEQIEEAIVQAIGVYAANPSSQKSSLSHAIKVLLKRIAKMFEEMFKGSNIVIPEAINPNTTLAELGILMRAADKVILGTEGFNNGVELQKIADKLVSLGRLTIACK